MTDAARVDPERIRSDIERLQAITDEPGNWWLFDPIYEVIADAEALAAEVARLQGAIDTVLTRDDHFVFCTGGAEPEHGCTPTCVLLRAALSGQRGAGDDTSVQHYPRAECSCPKNPDGSHAPRQRPGFVGRRDASGRAGEAG